MCELLRKAFRTPDRASLETEESQESPFAVKKQLLLSWKELVSATEGEKRLAGVKTGTGCLEGGGGGGGGGTC